MKMIKRSNTDPEKQSSITPAPLSSSGAPQSDLNRMSRRKLLEAGATVAGGMLFAGALNAAGAPPPWAGRPPQYPDQNDPAAALAYLLYGNQRYASGKPTNARRDQ